MHLYVGRCYSKGAQTAENYLKSPDTDSQGNVTDGNKSDVLNAYITCLNNLSACYISQKEYLKAKDVCTQIIELSPNNIKALLRAAKSSLALDLYEECELCLDTVLSIEPTNEAAKKEKVKLRSVVKQYKLKEKEMAVRTIQKLADSNTNASTTASKPQQLPATPTDHNQTKKSIDDATQDTNKRQSPMRTRQNPEAVHSAENKEVVSTEAIQTSSSKRTWSFFLLLFTSTVVLLVSVGIAWYLSHVRL